ncbi:hypothetical protein O5629_28085, partial [Escherichia coli]|nr:hypothetical protein [Escherichia coli]
LVHNKKGGPLADGIVITPSHNPPEVRGTYKALGHPVMINYLKQLGFSAVRLPFILSTKVWKAWT